ncbi:fungal-specific transcription factor domain-containing protein [Mycena galopus ATCC 62051]|nr:fungal-specific transcription factor domain-containing protein [Mycena galopus ATCC 62051]
MSWPPHAPSYTLPFADYDDNDEHDDDELDTPGGGGRGGGKNSNSKAVRRRSSKACDQCRKSKCKCERPAPGEPCRSCVLLGTDCTSLGPSRKRGPPKGYIDAIEARLHQTEALVGILLAAAGGASSSSVASNASSRSAKYAIDEEDEDQDGEADAASPLERNRGNANERAERENDERAHTLLADLAEDPLARTILARIDQSAYGPAGRAASPSAPPNNNTSTPPTQSHSTPTLYPNVKEGRRGSGSGSTSPVGGGGGGGGGKGGKTQSYTGGGGAGGGGVEGGHPSHEWMDRLTAHLLRRARERRSQHPHQNTQNQNRSMGMSLMNQNNSSDSFHTSASPIQHPHASPFSPRLHPHPQTRTHPLAHSQSHPHLRGAFQNEHAEVYAQHGQQHSAPAQPNQLALTGRAQRPAIVTALNGRDEYTQRQVQRGYPAPGPASASVPLSAGGESSDGRRVRRRVGEGPDYGHGDPHNAYGHGGRYRDSSVDAPFYGNGSGRRDVHEDRDRGRDRSYSPGGSGSEEGLDVDVPHSPPPPTRAATSYMREGRGAPREGRDRDRERGAREAEGLAGAVGQLSLNEDKQVRYHGKISGLHLLARRPAAEGDAERRGRGRSQARRPSAGPPLVRGVGDPEGEVKEEEDEEVGKNIGGIWRFPKARVWPVAPAPSADDDYVGVGEVDANGLPPRAVQEALLARYFAHVHPSFPVVHKRAVQDAWARGEGPPPLLLLAMFALAARHAPQPPASSFSTRSASPAPSQYMWPAGDAFLFRAKALLDNSYASSLASTCQALLLMGFREIGIGAMAQAWIYIGMAVRMAQDLGMQRDADGWVRAGVRIGAKYTGGRGGSGSGKGSAVRGAGAGRKGKGRDASGDVDMGRDGEAEEGEDERQGGRENTDPEEAKRRRDGKLFGAWEIAERRRIWYACVIMDKYVSTYIGRPLAIFERDFDTSLPSESDAEELEEWVPPSDNPVSAAARPGRVISCFNASARLSGILSQIVQSIYALRPASSRHMELVVLDGLLEKWHLGLPAHLQHDPARSTRSGGEVPLPQVLTLHMQYWCAVLLLHRPFIRQNMHRNNTHSPTPEDGDVRRSAEKSYELCAGAANHITSIATLYSETYTLKHCAVFLCYYIFTCSIMHVTSLSAHPTDPQARMGLPKCMEMLKEMEMIWPAAGRQLELLRGAQATLADAEDVNSITNGDSGALVSRPHKRPATQTLDDSFVPPPPGGSADNFLAMRQYAPVYPPNGHYGIEARSSTPAYYPPGSSPYERWPPEDGGALAFQSALSTAVMGPAYSTGLVDERNRAPPLPQQQQYWNEYAAFPPLESGYGQLHDPALHGEPQIYPLHDFELYPSNQ